MRKLGLLFLCALLYVNASAQQEEDDDNEDWPSPSVTNMMPRGILFSYSPVIGYDLESESNLDGLGDAETTVSQLNRILFKIKIPIILRDRTNFIVGFDYAQNEYEFKGDDYKDYPLYRALEEKDLRSREIKFYYNHAFDKKHYIYIRSSTAFNGDLGKKDIPFYEFANYSLAAVYGWQKSENNSYGVGLYLSYDLGQPGIYPVFVWNKTWNEKWGFESKIPANFHIRYNPNEKQRFFMGYEVQGASYNIALEEEQLAKFDDLQLRRSDILPSITYERELYDFIWIGVTAGYRINYRFDISEDNSFNNDNIIENTVQPGPYFDFTIFLTPTKTLKNLFLDE